MAANANEILSPIPDNTFIQYAKVIELDKPDFDFWVNKYSRKYFSAERDIEYTKYKLRCLYWKETRNGLDGEAHGDGGLAGGPYQFHQGTWDSYRRIMIGEGLVGEIGSRYNLEQAIETTAWAISTGRQEAWGPIKRHECL